LEQQVLRESISLVHTKGKGAGLIDGLADEMTGLEEGLEVTLKEGLRVGLENEMIGLDDGLLKEIEGLAMAGFLVGVDVGLDGLIVEGFLLGGIETAEICKF
jgi:hypothetical protein